jgi:hypothetical protein
MVPLIYRGSGGEMSVSMARVRFAGSAEMTRAEREQAAPLPDDVITRLREQRAREAGDRRYTAADFVGDARTLDGRHALIQFRAHAATLVHALAASPSREIGAYLTHLLLSLPVAYGGRLSLLNAVDGVQQALRDHVAAGSWGRTYDRTGRISDLRQTERPWPPTLMTPDTVAPAMLRELANGSAWKCGEALTDPSPADAKALRLELDPRLWDTTIAKAIEGKTEVRSQELYDLLHAEGLIETPTPSPEQRGRVSAALESMGFVKAEGRHPDGNRARVWRRAVAEAA